MEFDRARISPYIYTATFLILNYLINQGKALLARESSSPVGQVHFLQGVHLLTTGEVTQDMVSDLCSVVMKGIALVHNE